MLIYFDKKEIGLFKFNLDLEGCFQEIVIGFQEFVAGSCASHPQGDGEVINLLEGSVIGEDRKTGRQEDRKTGRQEDRKTGRQEDRKTGRQEDRINQE